MVDWQDEIEQADRKYGVSKERVFINITGFCKWIFKKVQWLFREI